MPKIHDNKNKVKKGLLLDKKFHVENKNCHNEDEITKAFFELFSINKVAEIATNENSDQRERRKD